MEIKKTSSASLENKSFEFLLMGLVVALGFLFIVFEWSSTSVTKREVAPSTIDNYVETIVPITIQKPETPPAPAERMSPRTLPTIIKTTTAAVPDYDFVIPDEDDPVAPLVIDELPIDVVDEDPVVDRAEVQPAYPGGPKAMMEFLMKHIKYPAACQEMGIQGRVFVQFVVNTDGSICNVTVLKPVDERLDAEAVRVVSSMQNWTPGKMGGKAVRCKFTLPVSFVMK